MEYAVHKLTYSEGRAYRYQVVDEAGRVQYLAEPTGLFLPDPTRQVTLFDAEGRALARLDPTPTPPWRWTRVYHLRLEGEEGVWATLEERWTLVDRILLRLPTYTVRFGQYVYRARLQRYGEPFGELIEPLPEEREAEPPPSEEEGSEPPGERRVGEILRPSSGANYVIRVEAPSLRQAPLVLIALMALIDLHRHE